MKFAKLKFAWPILAVSVISCGATVLFRLWPDLTRPKHLDPAFQLPSPLELASLPTAERAPNAFGAMLMNAASPPIISIELATGRVRPLADKELLDPPRLRARPLSTT